MTKGEEVKACGFYDPLNPLLRMFDLFQVTESLMEYQNINHLKRFPVWNMNMEYEHVDTCERCTFEPR